MAAPSGYDPHPAYRPEIDGMRAIAVLAVVLYHFGLPGVGGGLVGVDIFFVISGYLIGGILWRESRATGRILLSRFYLRRIRRLAPAFLVMALVALAVGWVVLLPFEFREFGKELIASASYLANVHFWRETGYFDPGVENKILLHTWSLSVEEQFYLVLPLVILALGRWRRAQVAALWALFALSLGASLWLTRVDQPAAFYLFGLRAWELLAGVLLAVHWPVRVPGLGLGARRAWPSWLGLGLMLAGIALVQPGAGFPGWQVMVPVAGAALVLANGQQANLVNTALGSLPGRFFGKTSYSLYLWHWPVLTLAQYWLGVPPGPVLATALVGLSVALGWASWRFVEQPARLSPRMTDRRLLALWAAGTVVLLGAGSWIYLRGGAPERFALAVRTHIEASADFLQDWSRCGPGAGPLAGLELCALGPEGPPQVLIWGDSHLRPLHRALATAADQAGVPAAMVWVAGCPPLFGLDKAENTTSPAEDRACRQTTDAIEAALMAGALPPRVLLVGRWSYYASGRGVGRDAANRITLAARDPALVGETQAETLARAQGATIARLRAHKVQVFVLRQPAEIPLYDSRWVAREMAHGRMTPEGAQAVARVPRPRALRRAAPGEAALRAAEAAGRITLLDPWPRFCTARACSAMPEGQALYFDNNHLTNTGGMRLLSLIAPLFEGAQ